MIVHQVSFRGGQPRIREVKVIERVGNLYSRPGPPALWLSCKTAFETRAGAEAYISERQATGTII